MKPIHLSWIGIVCALYSTSCQLQPTGNPYGVPAANTPASPYNNGNPYAVPQANGETGTYQQAPYQELPGVGGTLPPTQQPSAPEEYHPPEPTPKPATLFHTVRSGDSLWKLAREYNTTVAAIQETNNLSSSNIQVGETLRMPHR